jgi:long-chain acyl-CoA synthetase
VNLIASLKQYAKDDGHIALYNDGTSLSYAQLIRSIDSLSDFIKASGNTVIGLDMDNTPAWVIADLAALQANVCLVPLAAFFSAAQLQHIIRTAGISLILSDHPQQIKQRITDFKVQHEQAVSINQQPVSALFLQIDSQPLAADICKITFTSGTTGQPKGVLLDWPAIEKVIDSLADTVAVSADDRHLPIVPLAVLLENIAGVYVTLMRGGQVCLPGLSATGISGSSGLDVNQLVSAVQHYQPTTLITSPQILQALTHALDNRNISLQSLRFVAVGGARVTHELLQQARQNGLPAYQGYGLSECASVTTLNTVESDQPASVGKPLPHIQLDIADDGEVIIKNHHFRGYLGQAGSAVSGDWPTGDIGYLDEQGYLYISGRKKNMFITAMGRNVSPEWLETELQQQATIRQACVFGEGLSRNIAVLVSDHADSISEVLQTVNQSLPDYARISDFILASEPFLPANGLLTATGRNRREQIYQFYRQSIEEFSMETSND